MPRARRLSGSLVAIALVLGALTTSATGARADDGTNAQQQSRWPAGPGASPRMEGVAHALRFLGADRFETNLAVTLALRGKGGFPYTTSDRTSGGASSLGAASGWWGARSCPKAVIAVAGDNSRTLRGNVAVRPDHQGPVRCSSVAAADPLFDPIEASPRRHGSAPIIVTTSDAKARPPCRSAHGSQHRTWCKADARRRGAQSSSEARERCHGRSSQTC
jgi:hypothetical protein